MLRGFLVLALVAPAAADFLYDDKLGAGKSPVLPLGGDRLVRRAYEITRTTTGALGKFGGQHSQLILEFRTGEPMLAIDLHTVRDPRKPTVRLDLGAIFILRIAYEDVRSSKVQNSAVTMSPQEMAAAKAKNPSFAPKSIFREMPVLREVSEQEIFSFLRVWHKLFAHRYGKLQFNCQVMIGALWSYMKTGKVADITCPNCRLFWLPTADEQLALAEMTQERQEALRNGMVESIPGMVVDTLDRLDGQCGFQDRPLAANISAFPSPRGLPLTKHELHGGTAAFRAFALGLHHIGSSFDFSPHPVVFRGELSYVKRAFTSAEHSLLYRDDENKAEAASPTSFKVGPFTLALNLGGSLFKYLMNLPGHTVRNSRVDSGMELLKHMDLGRRSEQLANGQVRYRGRQRYTYAITDTRLEIATGGMLDTLKIPIGFTGLLSKTMKFDTLSKHNMHAGSGKELRYAGELVVVNKNPQHAHDVELWTADDEYEMVFDNGSGSYKPYFPAPELEELLHCNLPDVPGKFSIRVMRGSYAANQSTLDAYCDVWHGVDDIPEAEECKKSLGFVAVQPKVHKCCGAFASVKDEEVESNGTCMWQWPANVDDDCVEMPGICCQEHVVSQPGECSAEPVCKAQLMEGDGQVKEFLGKVDAGVRKLWGGRHDECTARQWRTRMFECFASHDAGHQALMWMREMLTYFQSDPSNEERWKDYLDNLNRLGKKKISLFHLQNGPSNLAKDEVVARCFVPFLNNVFPYVSLSLKLTQFLKMGIYDPAAGRMAGANLNKLEHQYQQYIFGEEDYKGESYKTGHDGEDGCGTSLTIPRAADEWGNAIAEEKAKSQGYEVNLTRAEMEELSLREKLGTFEVQCSGIIGGIWSDFENSLAGSMVMAVDGESTREKSLFETRVMIESALERGQVQVMLLRGIDPSFCRSTCKDRTPIAGSENFRRCWATKGMYTCGEHCCCSSGYQYHNSFLGLDHCSSC